MAWRRVAALDELWSGEMMAVRIGHTPVVLVHTEGHVVAFEDACAHLRVPLSEGRLEGNVLRCRAHHWLYDARTGCGINPRKVCLRRFAVKLLDGDILVDADCAPDPKHDHD